MWTPEVPPLGIASLAAALKKDGHEVKCFDQNLKIYKKMDASLWELSNARGWGNTLEFREKILPQFSKDLSEFARNLLVDGYEAVGLTTYGCNYHTVSWFATVLKMLNPEIKVVIGGPEVGDPALHRLANYQLQGVIDAAVLGEGEGSATKLFRAWQNGESILGIQGVIAASNGKLEFSGRPPALEVDNLLPPDFSDFELGTYTRDFLPVIFSRGCVANCTFCSEPSFLWPSFKMKSSEGIFDQLKFLTEKHGTNKFFATDSLLNGNPAKLEGFVDLVLARQAKFSWGGNMRINKRLKPPFTHRLREAGCETITFGVESGSNNVLKGMRKGITRDDILQVLQWVAEADIKISINLIVGFPGETEADFEDTLRLIDERGDRIVCATTSIFIIDPVTEIGKNPKRFGIAMDNNGEVIKSETTPYLGNTWFSETGDSTPEVRLKRLYRLREHMNSRFSHIAPFPTIFG